VLVSPGKIWTKQKKVSIELWLNGMRGSCLAFRFSLADRAVILEQIQTSCKIMLQMAETTLSPSVGEYYKEIKTSCKCDRWQGFSGTQLSDSSSHLSGR